MYTPAQAPILSLCHSPAGQALSQSLALACTSASHELLHSEMPPSPYGQKETNSYPKQKGKRKKIKEGEDRKGERKSNIQFQHFVPSHWYDLCVLCRVCFLVGVS